MIKKLLSKVLAAWIVAAVCGVFLLSDYVYAGSMNGGRAIPANLPVFKFNRSSQYNLKQIRPSIFQAKQDNIAPWTIYRVPGSKNKGWKLCQPKNIRQGWAVCSYNTSIL